MSDPRNVAHAKKVTQEKKHHGEDAAPQGAHAAQPGKKAAAAKPGGQPGAAAVAQTPAAVEASAPAPAALEGSLVVLTKLKELEFHSRTGLERLAELTLTVEDELKQKEMVGPLGEVYAAQNALQTKLTALIESYKEECDRMQGANT